MCPQLAGGCATASCLYGCNSFGESYQCGCPAGYQLVGAGHCLTALDGALPPDDIGDAPVFPVRDQYKIGGDKDLISTEGCFSCKVSGLMLVLVLSKFKDVKVFFMIRYFRRPL